MFLWISLEFYHFFYKKLKFLLKKFCKLLINSNLAVEIGILTGFSKFLINKMEEKEYQSENSRFNFQNFALIALVALLVGSLIVIAMLVNNRSQLERKAGTLKNSNDSLEYTTVKFDQQLDSLNDVNHVLEKQADDLLEQKEKLMTQRDSVARLLAYSRTNERSAKTKLTQLQKQLADLQNKLDDVQRKYDDLLANSGDAGSEYKKRLEALTTERDLLASENQKLKQNLSVETGNAENPLFVMGGTMKALPGEIVKNKFSASTRSQNTDRVQVGYTLSRATRPNESLVFKIFDATNKELAIKPKYRNELNAPADPLNQKVILEFEAGKLDRRASGRYSIRCMAMDINKGTAPKEIGITSFELK